MPPLGKIALGWVRNFPSAEVTPAEKPRSGEIAGCVGGGGVESLVWFDWGAGVDLGAEQTGKCKLGIEK